MSSEEAIHSLVQQQFGARAEAYTKSLGHADPAVLARIVDFAEPLPTDRVLDVATGAGHTALAFAPRVESVIALDLTPEMLEEVKASAAKRGLENVDTVEAAAEEIPFSAGTFDLVTVRLAPHHFSSVPHFLNEAARVLTPTGRLLMVDTVVPENSEVDEQMNEFEALRDPSHVRNYRPSEWREMLLDAGFTIDKERLTTFADGFRMELNEWAERMKTPRASVAQIREMFEIALSGLSNAIHLQKEGDTFTFELPELTILAHRG